jgi:hypothetical protein
MSAATATASKKQSQKTKLGQFYTTNYQYILTNLCIPENISHIIEPFAGKGDMLQFVQQKELYTLECYDIDPKKDCIEKRDTLCNPPCYEGKFVLTNPPYLARNKCTDKSLFDKYDVNDLYKCFIVNLIQSKAEGGIIIIPLNFWSSIRNMDVKLRQRFLNVYKVIHLNIFEEQVFNDTSYTVCAFQFELKQNLENEDSNTSSDTICVEFFPTREVINVALNEENNFTIGGEIYKLPTQTTYTISRLIKGDTKSTNLFVKCIDDNVNSKINMKFVDDSDVFYDETPNKSARTYATLTIEPEVSIEKQMLIANQFNEYLNAHRDKYHSLFMANYRESNTIARKRISFDLVYSIVGYLLTRDE